MISKAQIIITIGPASDKSEILTSLIEHQTDAIRFNFSWSTNIERIEQIKKVHEAEQKAGKKVALIQDLPGPRVQVGEKHTYDRAVVGVLTPEDKEFIKFGAEQEFDWVALSFVGSAADVEECREEVTKRGGRQKIMAKIERQCAVDAIDSIIVASDAIMIARGDLGNEVPIEKIPFIESDIIKKCKKAGKPVVTATEMMLTMVENSRPTRAEVTDVETAIIQGSDAVMLSEETSTGKHPVEAVEIMERIIAEAEQHMSQDVVIYPL